MTCRFFSLEIDPTRASRKVASARAWPAKIGLVLLAIGLARPGQSAMISVTTTNDSGTGSLRQAIVTANTNPGPNTIVFQIPGKAPFTIKPASALPALTAPVVIDATTQTGYSGQPLVALDGASTSGSTIALRFTAGQSTLRGLAINRFPVQALELDGASNIIQGNFVGTDVTGLIQQDNGSEALLVKSAGNLIGGTNAGSRNLFSAGANANSAGIYILDTSNNIVQGNLIGVNATGSGRFTNASDGIVIYGSSSNLIGGPVAAAANIISGNGQSGIYLTGAGATGNLIQGNHIGTDLSGSNAVGNAAGDGITLISAPGNVVSSNLISGNGLAGVSIQGATGNLILGNFIGTDVTGRKALTNHNSGVSIAGGGWNQVGGVNAGNGNVISGNALDGVTLTGGTGTNWIQGNLIGLNASGAGALRNVQNGITIDGATANVIGGTTAAARNVISGNTNNGIDIVLAADSGNIVQGNYIGTDVTGGTEVSNKLAGILIEGSSNLIGGTVAGAGNVISGNNGFGIFLVGTTASGNTVQGNQIGTDPTGTIALGNLYPGIYLEQAAANQIGGSSSGAGNVVSGNQAQGIFLTNCAGNVIQGNFVGTQANGAGNLGNAYHNIELQAGASNNVIGGATPGAGNTLAFAQSVYCGVRVRTGAANNLISANSIFSNGALGIDLSPTDGGTAAGVNPIVTCEDGVAADAANAGQNFPTLSNVYSSTITRVRGSLNAREDRTYTLQFFASPAGDPGGYGQGKVYLGQTNLTLGSSCSGNFTAWFATAVPAGWVTTATATDPNNNTSEFSAWVPIIPVPAVKLTLLRDGQLSLSWTNNGGSFALEQTTNLTPPAVWSMVTNVPVLTNQFMVTTLGTTAREVFYQLTAP